MSDFNLCVLGAGVVGLTTAVELQKEFRNATVTILAENVNENVTSFIAPGLFLPDTSFTSGSDAVTREWMRSSYSHWNDLFTTYGGNRTGIAEVSGYLYSTVHPNAVKNPYVEDIVPVYRQATEDELKLCPGDWKYGSFISTFVIENRIHLPWATTQFLNGNGKIIDQKIEDFSEISGKYDVVVNCTGLGAKFLCHDLRLVPIRGQIIKVHAPWVDKFYLTDFDTYIIPGFEGVTLGGTRQYGSFNQKWSKYDALDIKERCEPLLPKLLGSPVIAQRVGLRPHRSPVRVETEVFSVNSNVIKMVHNYGHGGYGVTTAPGTAKAAVKLVKDILMQSNKP